MNININKLDDFMCEYAESATPTFTYRIEQEHYISGRIDALKAIAEFLLNESEKE